MRGVAPDHLLAVGKRVLKVAGEEVQAAPEAPKAQIIDLLEALKRSVAQVGEAKPSIAKAAEAAPAAARAADAAPAPALPAKGGPKKAEPRGEKAEKKKSKTA